MISQEKSNDYFNVSRIEPINTEQDLNKIDENEKIFYDFNHKFTKDTSKNVNFQIFDKVSTFRIILQIIKN